MNKTCHFLLFFAGVFFALGVLVLGSRSGPAIVQSFGSSLACLWGAWWFRDKADK